MPTLDLTRHLVLERSFKSVLFQLDQENSLRVPKSLITENGDVECSVNFMFDVFDQNKIHRRMGISELIDEYELEAY